MAILRSEAPQQSDHKLVHQFRQMPRLVRHANVRPSQARPKTCACAEPSWIWTEALAEQGYHFHHFAQRGLAAQTFSTGWTALLSTRLPGRTPSTARAFGDYILSVQQARRCQACRLTADALAHAVRKKRSSWAPDPGESDNLKRKARDLSIAERVGSRASRARRRVSTLFNARAVYYAPMGKDYGYGTVEA